MFSHLKVEFKTLTISRLAYVHIFASQIRLSSAHELAELPPSWKIGIL